MKSMFKHLASTVAVSGSVALAQLTPQVCALVFLNAKQFGNFSLVYLVFAFGTSLVLSAVSEAGMRFTIAFSVQFSSKQYISAAELISVTIGVLGGALAGFLTESIFIAVAALFAILLAIRRSAVRYRELSQGKIRRVIITDGISGISFLLMAFILGALLAFSISTLFFAWTFSGLLALVLGTDRAPGRLKDSMMWFRDLRTEILPLLKESLVMDVASIGVPFLIAPVLGVGAFGVYRSIANFDAPGRLILNPLRPRIGAISIHRLGSRLSLVTVCLFSLPLGASAGATLWLIREHSLVSGVLFDLAHFALLTSVHVTAAFLGHAFYMVARTHAPSALLWRARIMHSVVALVLPLTGALVSGLDGALTLYVFATVLGSLIWFFVLQLSVRHASRS